MGTGSFVGVTVSRMCRLLRVKQIKSTWRPGISNAIVGKALSDR